MKLDELRLDISLKTKRGISFIVASIVIWALVLIIWILPIKDLITKNFLTFCVVTPLLPLSYMISKIVKAEFSVKENPLSKLGLILSFNQLLYIIIAMWIYNAIPDKMVMVLAVIFGAHLLPFGWLYKSKIYTIMSIFISVFSLILGLNVNPQILATFMIVIEIIFSLCLYIEHKKLVKCLGL